SATITMGMVLLLSKRSDLGRGAAHDASKWGQISAGLFKQLLGSLARRNYHLTADIRERALTAGQSDSKNLIWGRAMAIYDHILVALDLTEESTQILDRATRIGQGSRISLMHVIEPLAYAYGGDIPMDLSEVQNQLQQQATDQLARLGKSIGVAPEDQYVLIGQPTSEIHRLAEEKNVDLIVVGSHGRQGFALLLGSTANGVLHGTKRDVLAVRVDPNKT